MRRSVRQQFDHMLKSFGIRRSVRTTEGDPCGRYQLLLTSYSDGELDEKRRQIVEGHLNACPNCRASLAATRIVGHCMFERPAPQFTGDMSARLRMAIAEEARTPTRVPIFATPRFALGSAAFAVAIAAMTYQVTHHAGVTTIATNTAPVQHASPFPANPASTPVPALPSPSPAKPKANFVAALPAPEATPDDNAAVETPNTLKAPRSVIAPGFKIAKPSVTRVVVPTERHSVAPHVQVARMSTPSATTPYAPAAEAPLSAPGSSQVATGETPAPSTAPDIAPAPLDRAANNVVAREPQPTVSAAVYESAPSEPVTLGRRLHNTGTASFVRASVYVDQTRMRAGSGTASIVDAGFK